MKTQTLLIIAFGVTAALVYRHYKAQESLLDSREHQELVRDYLLGDKLDRAKPLLWIVSPNEENARGWRSAELKQPYLYVTIKSIVDKCKKFNVCLVNDESFHALLPDWTVDLDKVGAPEKQRIRAQATTLLLYHYGGMVVPASTLCFTDLYSLYEAGDFVVELPSRGGFYPDARFMGARKQSAMLLELLRLQKSVNNDLEFRNVVSGWLQKHVNVVDGAKVGVKNNDGGRIEIQDLMGKTPLGISPDAVYIPHDELLTRSAYGWFLRMSPKQFLESEMAISQLAREAFKNLV